LVSGSGIFRSRVPLSGWAGGLVVLGRGMDLAYRGLTIALGPD
jgi:hypothetical protein